jgi:hypothetical protein
MSHETNPRCPGSRACCFACCCRRDAVVHNGLLYTRCRSDFRVGSSVGPYLIGTGRFINFKQYGRQYVGFVKDGKRCVYRNFFKGGSEITHAASVPVVTCDGGDDYWGIEYSLDSRTFENIHFNGLA